jgi:hypothetical protein
VRFAYADELKIGIAGEHLVCADLLAIGIPAFMTAQTCSYDVAAQVGDRLVRIQVKAAASQRAFLQRGQTHIVGYSFWIRQGKGARRAYAANSFDILALVALEIKKIAYIPQASVRQTMQFPITGHKSLNTKTFEEFTFDKAI